MYGRRIDGRPVRRLNRRFKLSHWDERVKAVILIEKQILGR